MKTKTYDVDMCNGPVLGKIIRFSIPLILTNVLQLLFNAADTIIVGRFVGADALAAVGATTSLVNLIISLFIGLSVGVNVVAARYLGAVLRYKRNGVFCNTYDSFNIWNMCI